jgi:4-amino-4-deoxy-L-arabinose transferase-like glycosyltransferase
MLWMAATVQNRLHTSVRINSDPTVNARTAKKSMPRHTLVALVLLILIAALLRLHTWDNLPLIIDEIGFAAQASDILHGRHVPLLAPAHNGNPALYSALIAGVMRLSGQHMLAIRLVPIFFGTLTIPAIYALGREWWSPKIGLMSAAFVATWPAHVFLSRLSLYNGVEPFFSALALTFLLRAQRRGALRGYVLAGAMAAMAQHFYHGSRLLLVLIVILSLNDRKHFWGLCWLLATVFLLTLPQIAVLAAHDLPITGNLEPLRLPSDLPQNAFRALRAWVGQPDVSPFWLSDRPLLLLPALIPFLIGLVVSLRRWQDSRYAVLIVAPLLTTIFGGAILTAAPLYIRYVAAVTVISMTIAIGLQKLPRIAKLVLLVICLQGGWIAYHEHPREARGKITASQWIEADIAMQAQRLSPEYAVIAIVPADFDFVQTITVADYVAAMGTRRAIAINLGDAAWLEWQLAQLPTPVVVIDSGDFR